jgi:hypothetical protein
MARDVLLVSEHSCVLITWLYNCLQRLDLKCATMPRAARILMLATGTTYKSRSRSLRLRPANRRRTLLHGRRTTGGV